MVKIWIGAIDAMVTRAHQGNGYGCLHGTAPFIALLTKHASNIAAQDCLRQDELLDSSWHWWHGVAWHGPCIWLLHCWERAVSNSH